MRVKKQCGASEADRFAPRFGRAGERGTSLLEMGLLLPALLLLLLGIIDVGRYAQFNIEVANAAHAGAQYGAQSPITAADTTGIANAAVNDAQNILTTAQVSSSACTCNGPAGAMCAFTCSSADSVTYVQVTTTGTFRSLFGYVGVPSSVSKTVNMRVSN